MTTLEVGVQGNK
jgi:hypothetical protein